MFNIGDKVIHRQEGACTIKGLVDMNVDRVSKQYYLLEPLTDLKTSIYVSADADKQKNIRHTIKPNDLKTAQEEIKESPMEWVDNPKQRNQSLTKLITSMNFKEVLSSWECLRTRKLHNKLNPRDVQLLRVAQKLIFSEVAMIMDVKYEEIEACPKTFMSL